MAKKQKPADAAKDKAAKQKKMAIGLVCLLALAMAYAVHTMMALNGGTPSSKPQAADPSATAPTTPAATASPVPAAAPSLAGAPVAADPLATAATASATGSTQLIAVVSPTADAGQLNSFSRFESKDPFAGGAGSASASGGSSSSGSGSGGSSGSAPASPPIVPPAPPTPPPSSAVISVNGLSELVNSGGSFPASSPNTTSNGLFELVSLTAKTAKVSVVGGSYASGSQTLTLTAGKPVTLVNTADGTRYTLVLYPQGTTVPAAAAAGASSAGSSGSSTPVTTTTTPTTTTGG